VCQPLTIFQTLPKEYNGVQQKQTDAWNGSDKTTWGSFRQDNSERTERALLCTDSLMGDETAMTREETAITREVKTTIREETGITREETATIIYGFT